MPVSTMATFTPAPALAAPPARFHACTALISDRSGSSATGWYRNWYCAVRTCGARAMVDSDSLPSLTATALSEMSYSLVTLAVGALARSHALKSLRSADSRARSDRTASLEKSIFLPWAGRVRGEVLNGSPLSWTSALRRSAPGAVTVPSLVLLGTVLGAAGVVGVLATALILAGVATPAAAAPGESIASYDTRIQVSADGRMRIIETIVYDFGANSRHGLIRRIPATFRYDRTHDRVYPIDEVGVTMDGSTVPVERSAGGGYQVLKIGDPGRTVNGKHTYAIGYTVRGGLNSFADHEELYWNVIGGEWDVPIEAGRAEITGPAPVQRVACFAGPVGSRASCAEAVAEGATATVREPRLGEGRAL